MKLIIYGAGFWGEIAFRHFGAENVSCFCDSKVKEDEEKTMFGKKVISFAMLQKIWRDYIIVVSAGVNFNAEIGEMLESAGIEDYFIYPILTGMMGSVDVFIREVETEDGRNRMFKRYYKALAKRTGKQLAYLKDHADIMTLKPAKGAMREEQLKLLEFAGNFFEYIKELHIRPFLVYGNLIGAFRHRGFVPWDDDLDFGIVRREWDSLLEFAEKNCVVGTRCGDIWKGTSGERTAWQDIFEVHPEQYIFDIRSDMIHVYRSTYGATWKPGMDLWVFDFYDSMYEISEHRAWLEKLDLKLKEIDEEDDKVKFLREQRKNNPMISREETEYIFPGIDSLGGHPGRKDVEEWIRKDVIFPLKKVPYENTVFWAPNDMEKLLGYEYKDYLSFPDDIGIPVHIEMNEDSRKNG